MPSKGNRMKFLIIDISFLVGRMFDILNYNGKKKLLATSFNARSFVFSMERVFFFKNYGTS